MKRRTFSLRERILRWIDRNQALTTKQLWSWTQAFTYFHGEEFDNELIELRDEGILVCTNGVWWRRLPPAKKLARKKKDTQNDTSSKIRNREKAELSISEAFGAQGLPRR